MTIRLLIIPVLIAASLSAQTTVYLRDNPASFNIISPGCTNATPMVCTVSRTAGLSVGNLVSIAGVCASDGVYNISAANGIRAVHAIGSGTISLYDKTNTTPITGNGAWCTGGTPGWVGPQYGGKLTAYSLVSEPRGWFDGASGALTRQWALGTQNGLVNTGSCPGDGICVASNIATVTTTYAHGVQSGDHVSLFNAPVTYTSGITATGTTGQTCVLTNFTGGYTSAAATVALTGTNIIASGTPLVVTNPGSGYTTNPTTGSVSNGTATCSGTVIVSWPNRNGSDSDYTVTGSTTYTFTFTTTGVANGDYTTNATCGPGASPNGTIQGTDNCTRISQKAVITNVWWGGSGASSVLGQIAAYPSPNYKFPVDGGPGNTPESIFSYYASAFLVDQKNQTYLDAVLYAILNIEKEDGSTLLVNENILDGGNYGLSAYAGIIVQDFARAYMVGQSYLTSAQKQTFADKVLNDLGDPTPCTKTLAVPQDTLATGIAQAGDSTHITLAASDTKSTNYYVNNVIEISLSGNVFLDGVVTAYNFSTKVATVTAWLDVSGNPGTPPTTGTVYSIYSTVTLSGTTITGYHTTFTSNVVAGDYVIGKNQGTWTNSSNPGVEGSWVSSVNSDTSLTVVNAIYVKANSTPSMYWHFPSWTSGRCGLNWVGEYWANYPGSQPITYPVRGGVYCTLGSNNQFALSNAWIMMYLALADQDPRAITKLAELQAYTWDDNMSVSWNYETGISFSGQNYGLTMTSIEPKRIAWAISHSVVGYPSMNTAGPWTTGLSLQKIYSLKPDSPSIGGYHKLYPFFFGETNNNTMTYAASTASGVSGDLVLDHGSAFNPNAASSQYLKFWLINTLGFYQPGAPGNVQDLDELAIKIDPRITPSDYTVQPHQYLFSATNNTTCAALTGYACLPTDRGDVIYSRTGWSSASDTDLFFQGRSFIGDHDQVTPGNFQLYKAGYLLASDQFPIGEGVGVPGPDILDSSPGFAGAAWHGYGGDTNDAVSYIARWASANHGAWATAYGDQNSNYVYALAEQKGSYTVSFNHVQRSFAHLKKSGLEEKIIQYDDIDASNRPTAIAFHVHYPQNGETAAGTSYNVFYDEGSTTCPGSGACASLNANRTILEQENGINDGQGDPTPQYNLISKFLIPSGAPNVFVNYDGHTYSGANGHTERVAICADASSTGACGAITQSGLEVITVHKIATQPDTTLTTTALNPDGNWTGVQIQDATVAGGAVVLFARHGSTYSTLTGFTTTHTGTAQYLFAGLTAGTYTVTVNSVGVPGSPFTVGANDNTLYFESTKGTVSINGSAAPCAITTTSLPGDTVGTAYSQTVNTANCTTPVTWSIASGSLCAGLNLGSSTGATGTIGGMPTTAQTCNFTVQAVDAVPNTASQALSITIATGAAAGGSSISAGAAISAATIRH